MANKKFKIKKGDQVIVLSGSSRGKQGEVLKVLTKTDRALVEGVNLIKKHTKPSAQNPQGGIVETEGPIHISNLAVLDQESGKGTRVGYKLNEDGTKSRIAKKSGKAL